MFQTISWGNFLTTTSVLIVIYYIIIGILYFRKDLPSFITRMMRKRTEPIAGDKDSPEVKI